MTLDPASIAFSGGLSDRASAKRSDPDWVSQTLAKSDSQFLFITGEDIVVQFAAGAEFPTLFWVNNSQIGKLDLDKNNAILLGIGENDTAFWALSVASETLDALTQVAGTAATPFPLRSLAAQGHLPALELATASQAKALVNWHDAHPFCSTCGAGTMVADAGARRLCPKCQTSHFPRVNPVAIMLIHKGDKCLLGRQAHFPPGMFTALAGFVEAGEDIEEAVRREVFEESGIKVGKVHYIASQHWPFPSNLMIGCHGEALSSVLDPDFDELEDVRWFTRDEVRQILAGDHPGELRSPPTFALAHHLLSAFVNGF